MCGIKIMSFEASELRLLFTKYIFEGLSKSTMLSVAAFGVALEKIRAVIDVSRVSLCNGNDYYCGVVTVMDI